MTFPQTTLSRLLRPSSLAVIGGEWAAAAARSSLQMNYRGKLWAVHPHRKTLAGIRCYRTVRDLPSPPDAAFVGVNRAASVDVVCALSNMGGGGAVCFASGFGEANDGGDLQNKLLYAAKTMPVLGPNCYGFINYLDGAALWPDIHGGKRQMRGAALICQSSNIAINLTMQKRALPLSYVVCIGNQMQTDAATIGMALLNDKRVSAIGMYLESFKCAESFAAFAAAAKRTGIGVVVIKSGASKQSRQAAAAHTASICGEAQVSSAFLHKCAVAEVCALPQLMEALKLLHLNAAPKGKAFCALSCSGGEAGLMADAAARYQLQTPQPKKSQVCALGKHLGAFVRIANPLDYHTFVWGDDAATYKTFALMLSDNYHLNILVLDYPRRECDKRRGWQIATAAFCRAAKRLSAPCAILATLPENMPESEAQRLMRRGIVPLAGIDDALAAVAALAKVYNSHHNKWRPLPPMHIGKTQMPDEFCAKQMLVAAGIKIPEGQRAQTAKQAADIARTLQTTGGAVALKGLGFAHKVANNALRLNLQSANAVYTAAKTINAPKGFLVEEMINNAAAELLLCARRDEIYGNTLTLAIGGAVAESLCRSQTIILPAGKQEILAALKSLRYVNSGNLNAVATTATSLAIMLADNDNLTEMEINPLLLLPNGEAIAADALATMTTTKGKR